MQHPNQPSDTDSSISEALSDLLAQSNSPVEPFEVVEDVVQKPKRKQKRKFYVANFRLYAAVAGIAALTTVIVAAIVLVAVTPYFIVTTPTSVYPTMFPQYSRESWNWDVPLMTNSIVGTIPFGAQVHIQDLAYDGSTQDWHYTIRDDNGQQADAWTWQLMPVPQPTPTPFPFAQDIGMGALFITTEPVGSLPANTRVRISQATTDQDGWLYTIVSEDERSMTEVRSWQITYAPGVTPGMTPTSPFNDLFGTGQFVAVTRVRIGDIPANTRVNISGGYFNGREWAYSIVSQDGHYADYALQSQLAPAQDVPSPTPPATDTLIP